MQTNACFNQDISNLTSFSLFCCLFVRFSFNIICSLGTVGFHCFRADKKDQTIVTWSERVTSLSVYVMNAGRWLPEQKKKKNSTSEQCFNFSPFPGGILMMLSLISILVVD